MILVFNIIAWVGIHLTISLFTSKLSGNHLLTIFKNTSLFPSIQMGDERTIVFLPED